MPLKIAFYSIKVNLFLCVYCTKSEPIFKTNDVPRAERVVAWN